MGHFVIKKIRNFYTQKNDSQKLLATTQHVRLRKIFVKDKSKFIPLPFRGKKEKKKIFIFQGAVVSQTQAGNSALMHFTSKF